MVLGLKFIGKLITCDNYLGVRQNQGLARSSDSNPRGSLHWRLNTLSLLHIESQVCSVP